MVTAAAGVAALFWLVAPRGDFGRLARPVEATAREPRTTSVPVRAGRVERVVEGAWSRTSAAGRLTASRSGDELLVGAELTTEVGGRLAMRLESGHSVRLDTASAIRIAGPGELASIRGAVYVDSGAPGRSAGAIRIQTPHGAIRDEERSSRFATRARRCVSVSARARLHSKSRRALPSRSLRDRKSR